MGAAAGPNIIKNGLVLWLDASERKSYPGSGNTWTNLMLVGNNGILTNGPTFNSENGGSIVFDGSNDQVRIGSVTSSTTGNITYNIWFKISALPLTQTLFWDDDNQGGGDSWVQITSSGAIQTQRNPDGFLVLTTPSSIVALNTWYNLCFVASTISPRKSIYLNGVLVASDNNAIASRFNRSYITLGANFDGVQGGSSPLNGNISIFSVYTRALTFPEVLQNYNATKGRFGLP